MRILLKLAISLLAPAMVVAAQVQPAATGPWIPVPPGLLNYAIRYSHSVESGAGLGTWQTSALSGSLDYSNGNERLPFSMTYGGGYNWAIGGPDYNNGLFQHLLISQALAGRTWNVSASDDVSYTPSAPTFGFTGIPGLGEPIAGQNPAPYVPDQSILSVNTKTMDNTASTEAALDLGPTKALSVGGSYAIMRFPDNNGISTDDAAVNGGLTWRLDARNSLFGNYVFSQLDYPDYHFSFQTHAGMVGFERAWTRKITTNVSAGPEWTVSSNSTAVPPSLGVTADANLTYKFGYSSASLNYDRGINGGAGYLLGAQMDTISANYSRQYVRNLSVGFTGSYVRTAGLGSNGSTAAKYGGAQATWQIGRRLSVFGNYSAIAQSSSAALPRNALGQLIQMIGFGVGFSSPQIHLRR